MFNFLRIQRVTIGISACGVVISIALLLVWGIQPGIDFTGGTFMELTFEGERPAVGIIEEKVLATGIAEVRVQPSNDRGAFIRTPTLSNEQREHILSTLQESFGTVREESYSSIGPTIGVEVQRKALTAIIAVLLGIIVYITWAFRKVSGGPVPSWFYGLGAIVALIHDILIPIGVIVLLGKFSGVEADTLFVTALLTILGFSVHDTIVVYDRVRENLRRFARESFANIVNISMNETIVRSINTSMTALIVLLALLFFGGESIRNFVLILSIGIGVGTYSSIFVAGPLLVWYAKRKGS